MARARRAFPVVDIFAGPGGLGEGFASLRAENGKRQFDGVVAIEREEFSHRTLLLRHFLHRFPDSEFPDDYYDYLRGGVSLDELYRLHESKFTEARDIVRKISLGPESRSLVRKLIKTRIAGRRRWALVGGPPCQAYSLAGRSRMMGDPLFEQDERHFLYREYLKIIIDHAPPVFVMENVKGLLSATVDGKSMVNRIVSDLSHPRRALRNGTNGLAYKLYSLTERETVGEEVDPRLFLIRSESYGVPQARHRMFIVGVRSDITIRPKQLRPHSPPTVRDTIGHLAPIRSGLSGSTDTPERWRQEVARLSSVVSLTGLNGSSYAKAILSSVGLYTNGRSIAPTERHHREYSARSTSRHRALAGLRDSRLPVLTAHESRGHMAADLHRYMYAAIFAEVAGRSPRLADFPPRLLPKHQNVELGRDGKMFSDRFRVQLPDQVATTITSHISKDGHYFIHYDPIQCRSLTVREAARLQTFPDNYSFEGSRTSQYHQVGNAVPPFLANQIAEIIAEILESMGGAE